MGCSLIAPVGVDGTSASGDEGGSPVVVESAGDQATATILPPAAVVGQAAGSVTTIHLSITAQGSPIDLAIRVDLRAAVSQVAPDGGYTAVTTIDRIQLFEAPEGVDRAALGYEELAGARFQQTFDRAGQVLSTELLAAESLSDAARSAAQGFTGNLQSAQFVYPAEPVGVGAKWSAELEITTEGLTLPATYHYELTDVSDGRYTVTVSYRSTIETTIQGAPVSGTVAGLGSVSGSIDNPLDVSVTLGQTIDATTGGTVLNVAIGIDVQSSER